jgi:hypothetical protein
MSRPRASRSTVITLCFAGFCFMSALAIGFAGGASAADLLFSPLSGKFPYHLVGTGGAAILETLSGKRVEAASTDVLALVLGPTLFDLHIEYLKVKSEGSACKNGGKTEAVLLNLLGHFGLADPGIVPAALLLVPSGFEFECLGGLAKIKLRGAAIGTITTPSMGEESEELALLFKQTKGISEYATFLLGAETLTNQIEETSLNGGAFERSGQEGALSLKALTGEGKFELLGLAVGLHEAGNAGITELNFKKEPVGSKKEIEVLNVGTAPMEIGAQTLDEKGGVAEGTNFMIVVPPNNATEQCQPDTIINLNDRCFVGIELKTKMETSRFLIKWGARSVANKVAPFPLESE